jgi:hypothetical protein
MQRSRRERTAELLPNGGPSENVPMFEALNCCAAKRNIHAPILFPASMIRRVTMRRYLFTDLPDKSVDKANHSIKLLVSSLSNRAKLPEIIALSSIWMVLRGDSPRDKSQAVTASRENSKIVSPAASN